MSEGAMIVLPVFGLALLIGIYLLTRWWFWALVGTGVCLACFVMMFVSVFHLQFITALGFLVALCLARGFVECVVDHA